MDASGEMTGGLFGEGVTDFEIWALIDEELARQEIPRQAGWPGAEVID
jgi:hypothetical protein